MITEKEEVLMNQEDYSEYKTDSEFIQWSKEGYTKLFIKRNPILKDSKDNFGYGLKSTLSLREATHQRQEDSEAFAESRFLGNSDYQNWQEWKHYLKKK